MPVSSFKNLWIFLFAWKKAAMIWFPEINLAGYFDYKKCAVCNLFLSTFQSLLWWLRDNGQLYEMTFKAAFRGLVGKL